MNLWIQLKTPTPLFLTLLQLACFAILQSAQAVVPAPDGGYPGANTAEGQSALLSLTTGTYNTAVGILSLKTDTTGSCNTALGAGTLVRNTGDENAATGFGTLLSNMTGAQNTANGTFALLSNTSGGNNTANGVGALYSNTSGFYNTANGWFALFNNTTGTDNIALGTGAGGNVTTANEVIVIGADLHGADVSNTTWIENIYGTTTQSGTTLPVIVSDGGQLGTASSSRRYKTDIKPMDKASESILALKPVSFRYKTHKTGTPQFGLIAEEVAEVNPDLVVRDKNGEIYTVRYDAVNAMLLNEFLKEHSTVQEQQKQINSLRAELKEQRILIQKVSAQLEVSKPAPQTVLNSQ
jgi:hypothetical protein